MVRGRRRSAIGLVAALVALGGLAACEPAPPPTTFTVNRFADGPDAAPGDGTCEVTAGLGDCSLRAAVDEGNATDGPARIGFVPTDRYQGFVAGTLPVSSSMTIEGPARVSGRVVHTAGDLVLRELDLRGTGGNDACGTAVHSVGRSLGLDRVYLDPDTSGPHQPMLCATGALTIVDSMVEGFGRPTAVVGEGPTIVYRSTIGADGAGLDVSGAPSFTIANATLEGLRTGHASGTVTFAWLTGTLGPATTVRGSVLVCQEPTTVISGGHNLDVAGACGATAPTDQAPPTRPQGTLDLTEPPMVNIGVPLGSPTIDAIPAGTPGLCDGTWIEDQKGAPRPADRPCDIGPVETQATIAVTTTESRPVMAQAPVRVNASGTVAATFPGEDGTTGTVGRWAVDGTFSSSGIAGSELADIADDGTVVGSVTTAGVRRPWRWHPDGASELLDGPAGTTGGRLLAIDADGVVVGTSHGVTGTVLWWQAPGGVPVVLPSPLGEPTINSIRDGVAFGHQAAGVRIATVWDLATGTVTTLPGLDGADPEVQTADATAFDVTPDGTILGEYDHGIVSWRDGGGPATVAEFTAPLAAQVVGSIPVVVSVGNAEAGSSTLYVLTEHATDVRVVGDLTVQDLSAGGFLVGTRPVLEPDGSVTGHVERRHLTITT